MAVLIITAVITAATGAMFAAYLTICFAIRREDRIKGSLRFDAPSRAARSARTLVGMSSHGWD